VQGEGHLQAASKLGLFVNSETLPKLAWFEYLLGNTEQSVRLLGQAATYQKGEGKALSFYYRGAILNRLERYDQAQASLSEALAEGGTRCPQRVGKVTTVMPKDLRLRRPIYCHRLADKAIHPSTHWLSTGR